MGLAGWVSFTQPAALSEDYFGADTCHPVLHVYCETGPRVSSLRPWWRRSCFVPFIDVFAGPSHLETASDESCSAMNYRISLSLALLAGCTVTQNNDTATAQGSGESGTSENSGNTAAAGTDTTPSTDSTPTGGADTSATEGDSDAGGQSASQSGSSTSGSSTESEESGTSGAIGSSSSSGSSSSGETGECMVQGKLEPVDLGSAEDLAAAASYSLLAKTAITNVTGSAIVGGNVGLSPAAATFITGFSMIADPSGQYSTSVSVVAPGKIYAANYAVPTPSNLTTAVSAMQAAYTDAAGRPTPDYLNLKGGHIGGLTLEPGLYTWGSAVLIPDDVTLSGCPDDVWIFQIADDLDVSAAKNVILSGGAQAKNVFWQVAGQATIHANAHFEGIILSKTGITLQTGASMNGRALAQTMIALDDNMVTAP